jgi:predicted metal-binding protein
MEKTVSKFKRFFLTYHKQNLDNSLENQNNNHSELSEEQKKKILLIGSSIRDTLEREIIKFVEENQDKYKKKLVLWDGFCRVCYNEKDKGCNYDSGDPCRYPNKKRYSMEAVGIHVTDTVKNLNLDIEWPPKNHIYRFGLVCFK